MELQDVHTWEDYKASMRSKGPEEAAVIDKCERIAHTVSLAMDALEEIHMGMYQYDLDEALVEVDAGIEEDEPEEVLAVV